MPSATTRMPSSESHIARSSLLLRTFPISVFVTAVHMDSEGPFYPEETSPRCMERSARMPKIMRILHTCLAAGLLEIAGASSALAQGKFTVLGPNECLNCHDHDAEKQWYEKKEI